MIDIRCNFCGDVCDDNAPCREIAHSSNRKFNVSIVVKEAEIDHDFGPSEDMLNLYSMVFRAMGTPPKPPLHICWNCACDLVGVAVLQKAPTHIKPAKKPTKGKSK